MQPHLVIVMGVSGSGKSLVGNHLAQHLDSTFVDGDDLHPPENVERMRAGSQLDDDTRKPWLAAICECAESWFAKKRSVVIACSALKKKYRQQLRTVSRPVVFVFLDGPQQVILERINARQGHFMPAGLLESQIADLENPAGESNVVTVKIDQTKEAMLAEAVEKTKAKLG